MILKMVRYGVIILIQIAIMVVFLALIGYGIAQGEGVGTVSLQPIYSSSTEILPLLTGATILCFSFLGFDSLSALSEETPEAGKVIPKAIILTALLGGLIFVVVAYALQLYFPDASRFKAPDAVLPLTLDRPVDILLRDGTPTGDLRLPGEPWQLARETRWISIPWIRARLDPTAGPVVESALVVDFHGHPRN